MKIIYTIYFKSDRLKVIILISYEYLKINRKIKLKEIRFFDKETNTIAYIKRENLVLVKDKNQIEYKEIQVVKEVIQNYLAGADINLYNKVEELDIDLNIVEKFRTKFSQDVIKYLSNLKRGELTTYSEIGKNINSKAYRAIGTVLKRNSLPLIIPCHRVIRKDGKIGGFMGETKSSWQRQLKKDLLELEQIKVN
ncbi:MAG: methylated-DNA--[protein]-cysteine S-methyltransferase [Promethearchaeota archaeon]